MTMALPISVLGDGVATIQIATDDQPYMEESFADLLSVALRTATADRDVRVVVLIGGRRYFSAGASREALLRADPSDGVAAHVAAVPSALLDAPVPVVAAMVGHAIGGGLALGLWCDAARLAAESLYGANFIALGFTPGMGSTVALEEALGAPLARDLLLSGRLVTGAEIKGAGCPLAHAVLPRDEVGRAALQLAREMADAPRAALELLKATLASYRHDRLAAAQARETADHARLFGAPAVREEIARRYGAPGASFQ